MFSINPSRTTKTGRNDICPCGSGKKYKKCCVKSGSDDDQVTEELSILWRVTTDRVDPEIRRLVLHDPSLLQSHENLTYIGAQLGAAGLLSEALVFQRKALSLRPKNDEYKLNLAATLSLEGLNLEALEIVDSVMEGAYRKSIIKANILRDSGNNSAAIRFYEEAVREEPGFYLPYLNLISCHNDNPEAKKYWIERSIQKFPENPNVALEWVKSRLNDASLWSELREIQWFSNLSSKVDKTVINNDLSVSEAFSSLTLLSDLIVSAGDEDIEQFGSSVLALSDIDATYRCSAHVFAAGLAINLGLPKQLETCINQLCETCAKNYQVDELKFGALKNSNQKGEAVRLGREILRKEPNNQIIIPEYLSLLDDLGKTDEAISETIRLTKELHISDSVAIARIYYDLANYSAKLGLWGTVQFALEEFERSNFLHLMSLGDYFLEPICNLVPNRILSKIGQLKFSEVEEEIISYMTSEQLLVSGISFTLDESVRREIASDLRSILEYAYEVSERSDFLNLLAVKISNTHFGAWCGKTRRVSLPHSISTLLTGPQLHDPSTRISSTIAAFRMQMMENGEISEILTGIGECISGSRLLNEDVLRCFIDADMRQYSLVKPFDYAPIIMSYCKGLELFVRRHVFETFRTDLLAMDSLKELLEQANSDKNISQFRALLVFLKSGRIELGSIAQVLNLLSGSTAARVELLSQFKVHLEKNYPCLLLDETRAKIQELASDYRNLAVHERGFNEEDSIYVRENVYRLLDQCHVLRIVS